jgi:hypothetical protein
MSDTLPQRPTFSNGQYVGAADLNAAVDYARDKTERLSLSGRTWGIATGLALIEIADATGATQMYIEPGIAWDGYGRAIVVTSPAPVTADLFAGLPPGNQKVWLKYSALDTQMISPGFRTCGTGDPATRIADTYAIRTSAPIVMQQTDGVVLNGVTVPDPRDMLIAFDPAAAVVLDGSAPHQLFPDDTAEWLVPVGIVSYDGVSGFKKRTAHQLALNRVARCYVGTVAESILAADGVLRLRDRQTDLQGNSDDDLDQAASIKPGPPDLRTDPYNSTRLIGNELVWVEGDMRVVGDARLWGHELSLRASDGTEPAGSFFLRRNADKTTQNLEVSIGQPSTGTTVVNRLLVAASDTTTTPATLVTPPTLAVGTDMKVGIGVAVPKLTLDIAGDFNFGHDGDATTLHLNNATVAGDASGNLVLTSGGNMIELGADGASTPTQVVINTKSPQGDVALDVRGGGIAVNNDYAFLRLNGCELLNQQDGILHISSGGNIVTFDPNNKVGIGIASPGATLDVSGDAHVAHTLYVDGGTWVTGGITVSSGDIAIKPSQPGNATLQLRGSTVFDDDNGVLHLWSGGMNPARVAFDGPNVAVVSVGTKNSLATLEVNGRVEFTRGTLNWSFPPPSDVRLKKDIRPLESALEKLLALRGVEFEWTREDLARLHPGRQTGLIADEVEAVFPEWVHVDPANGTKLLGVKGFEALVVEALRQLAKRVELLEKENSRLSQLLPAGAGKSRSARSTDKSAAPANGASGDPSAATTDRTSAGRDK